MWRHADAAAALSRVAARALIGCQRIGDTVHGDLAMHIAMETFTIRFVCGFGENMPDGVVPIDDIFDRASSPPVIERYGDVADHVALVTFDITPEGIVPVARSHAELIAGGLAAHLEARIEPEAIMLGALALASFAGLAATVVPWLLTGGTLVLHHPVRAGRVRGAMRGRALLGCGPARRDGDAARGCGADRRGVARGAGGLARAGAARGERRMERHRDPHRRAGIRRDRPPAVAPWRRRQAGGVRGRTSGAAARRAAGHACADRHAYGGGHDRALRPNGASRPLPPGAERGSAPRLKIAEGSIDTFYPCRVDRETKLLTVDAPPAGLVSVGGYRFALRAAQDLIAGIEDGSTLAALPDMLAGHRLAGAGADRDAICDALLAQGANPLLVAAFRRKSPHQASAA